MIVQVALVLVGHLVVQVTVGIVALVTVHKIALEVVGIIVRELVVLLVVVAVESLAQ